MEDELKKVDKRDSDREEKDELESKKRVAQIKKN